MVGAPTLPVRLMTWLRVSVMKIVPWESTATPNGWLKRAALPRPSAEPAVPAVPARVVTVPVEVIRRRVWLLVSAT